MIHERQPMGAAMSVPPGPGLTNPTAMINAAAVAEFERALMFGQQAFLAAIHAEHNVETCVQIANAAMAWRTAKQKENPSCQ